MSGEAARPGVVRGDAWSAITTDDPVCRLHLLHNIEPYTSTCRLVDPREDGATNPLRERERKKKRLMVIEPCAARTAGEAHNPPLDRQASWHQCLTECQRVDDVVAMECAKREPSEKTKKRRISPEPCHAARLSVVSGNGREVNKA